MRCAVCRLQGLNPLGCHQKRPQSDVSQGGALLGDSSFDLVCPFLLFPCAKADGMTPVRGLQPKGAI